MAKVAYTVTAVLLVASCLAFGQPGGGGGPGGGGPGGPGGSGGGRGQPSAPPAPPGSGAPSGGNGSGGGSSGGSASQSYHGRRMSGAHDPFAVVSIEAGKKDVRVIFNVPIDPRTFTHDTILLNGRPLAPGAGIRFNRSGKLVECVIALPPDRDSVLVFTGARSFDGQPLATTSFAGLRPGTRFHYPDSRE